jgi:hypothetical protein
VGSFVIGEDFLGCAKSLPAGASALPIFFFADERAMATDPVYCIRNMSHPVGCVLDTDQLGGNNWSKDNPIDSLPNFFYRPNLWHASDYLAGTE